MLQCSCALVWLRVYLRLLAFSARSPNRCAQRLLRTVRHRHAIRVAAGYKPAIQSICHDNNALVADAADCDAMLSALIVGIRHEPRTSLRRVCELLDRGALPTALDDNELGRGNLTALFDLCKRPFDHVEELFALAADVVAMPHPAPFTNKYYVGNGGAPLSEILLNDILFCFSAHSVHKNRTNHAEVKWLMTRLLCVLLDAEKLVGHADCECLEQALIRGADMEPQAGKTRTAPHTRLFLNRYRHFGARSGVVEIVLPLMQVGFSVTKTTSEYAWEPREQDAVAHLIRFLAHRRRLLARVDADEMMYAHHARGAYTHGLCVIRCLQLHAGVSVFDLIDVIGMKRAVQALLSPPAKEIVGKLGDAMGICDDACLGTCAMGRLLAAAEFRDEIVRRRHKRILLAAAECCAQSMRREAQTYIDAFFARYDDPQRTRRRRAAYGGISRFLSQFV